MNDKEKDSGSLTFQEYEEILISLKEYKQLLLENKNLPIYIEDIRKARHEKIQFIINKMENRIKKFTKGYYY